MVVLHFPRPPPPPTPITDHESVGEGGGFHSFPPRRQHKRGRGRTKEEKSAAEAVTTVSSAA